MSVQMEKKLLSKLLDKYFNSKCFTEGSEKAKPALSASDINEIVKKDNLRMQYGGDKPSLNDPRFIDDVNSVLTSLEKKGYVTLAFEDKDNSLYRAYIVKESVEKICSEIGYLSKSKMENDLELVLQRYENEFFLDRFVEDQRKKLKAHKTVKYSVTNGKLDLEKFENILKGVSAIISQRKEIPMRVLSIQVYQDSKVLESLLDPICHIIIDYSNASEYKNVEKATDVLQYFNVIKNPTYVYMKGNATIHFINGASYELFGNSIGILSKDFSFIKDIQVNDPEIMTIENLTTFHDEREDVFSIYLGGYHNESRCKFLKKLYESNTGKTYYHFGDIDSGGFYIYRRLTEQTQIPFKTYKMDLDALREGKDSWKPLTGNDVKRLTSIKTQEDMKEFYETIDYMIRNNCKLEQEFFTE